ncbi:MAG TPA: MBL fold metallo-hydrolase [Acidimicrobiia bacterium]|nr:MBL fold metallo-hydrolase [Acidimicrobiia bacterium]
MRPVADGVYALGTRGHNFYVLRDGNEATVIDAGCSREWKKLEKGLASIGLALDAVAGIVATHSHADHLGLGKRAAAEGISVSVHEDERSRALGTYSGRFAVSSSELPMFRIRTLRNFLPMVFAGVTKFEHLDEVGTFSDGDRLDLPGTPVVVHTPGHTEGHTMFHCPQFGLLFTGDGLVTMDLLGPGTGPQLIEKRFNLDHDQAGASLDRIVGLEADTLLPGHGSPWQGSPAEAVALARALT